MAIFFCLEVVTLKEYFLRKYANLKATVLNKIAIVQTTELVLILFVAAVIAFAVVTIIMKSMGDGESEDGGGILKSAKDRFDKAQT